MRPLQMVLLAVAVTALHGCAKTELPTNRAASGTAATSFGVPECDSYAKKYKECIESKVPEAARAQYKADFQVTQDAWRRAAATPEGKAGLAAACTAEHDAAADLMKAYGCTL